MLFHAIFEKILLHVFTESNNRYKQNCVGLTGCAEVR